MSAAFEPEAASSGAVATRGERIALLFLQAGVIASVFAVTTHKAFELDRFLVPKELVLHLTALLGALFALGALRRMETARVDLLLVAWLALGAVSAVFATNPWLGFRALAVTVSAAIVFWTARALRGAGFSDHVLTAIAVAVVIAAVTSLLQAYGLRTELFSVNRAPGGTLGNRNFVGHAAAFGFPIVLLTALRARSGARFFAACGGLAITIAALVLTRSRAAWLACGVVVAVTFLGMLVSPALRRDGQTWRRASGAVLCALLAVAAALLLPNSLRWRSDNPYLDSIANVADYEEGSGRGRLLQYERSLRMAASDPLLGAGPGNWPVRYPEFAVRNDPSIDDGEPGTTFNPWPSSDWVAYVVERGMAATALLVVAFLLLLANAMRRLLRAFDPGDALRAVAMLGTIAGAGVTGAFDAVLLLGLPSLLVWSALGSLYQPAPPAAARRLPRIVIAAALLIAAAAATRSTAQVVAMELYTSPHGGDLRRAALIDPANYRVQMRLARIGPNAERCAHAKAARALLPNAAAARAAARGCR